MRIMSNALGNKLQTLLLYGAEALEIFIIIIMIIIIILDILGENAVQEKVMNKQKERCGT